MKDPTHVAYLIIGSGPGGEAAANLAAQHGKSVIVVEKDRVLGGACVHQGTIPSKTLRESALNLSNFLRSNNILEYTHKENVTVESLMQRKNEVQRAYVEKISQSFEKNKVHVIRGRASFMDEKTLHVLHTDGSEQILSFEKLLIATGSRPRDPEHIPIDHENILDSDSILSMIYLPKSLTILGGGVIACEYACIFTQLGVEVSMVDTKERPLNFLDPQLSEAFRRHFESSGGIYIGKQSIERVHWDGISKVITVLQDGTTLASDKMLVAMGRVANTDILKTEQACIKLNQRGNIVVDENYRSSTKNIYAVGDVIGFPSLASTATEQGRRAVSHALGLEAGKPFENIPVGIYTIPEISTVGLTEEQAVERYGRACVGIAYLKDVARGKISGVESGLLKLVSDGDKKRLLGVHIFGEGASDLVHVGLMALLNQDHVEIFVKNIFNFPTMGEAYRLAAMDLLSALES